MFGGSRIGDITDARVQQFIQVQQKAGVKPATINRRLHVLRQTLKYARIQGYLVHLPHIPRLSEAGNARQGYFTDQELQRLLPHLSPYLRDFTLFCYLSGWRKSEAASLRIESIDWSAGVIRLRTSKNSEARVFPITGEMEMLLQKRLRERNGPYLFHQGDGSPVGDIYHNWQTACRRASLYGKLFHDLRRTAVRNFIAAGLSERHTMALCGHKTNHMLHRYHVVVEQDLKQAMLTLVRPNFVPASHGEGVSSPQPLDNTSRERIGAGVPPGLQIQ